MVLRGSEIVLLRWCLIRPAVAIPDAEMITHGPLRRLIAFDSSTDWLKLSPSNSSGSSPQRNRRRDHDSQRGQCNQPLGNQHLFDAVQTEDVHADLEHGEHPRLDHRNRV